MNQKLFIGYILVGLVLSEFLVGCKLQPNLLRSSLQSSDAFDLIDRDTIGFRRRPDPTRGEFYFVLKGPYHCRVSYWAEDLTVTPNAQSPYILECPSDQTRISFELENLEAGIPYTFKISVWPQSLSPEASATAIYHEGSALNEVQTGHMIVARHVIPRQSTEIYTYQFEGETNLLRIREQYAGHYKRPSGEECSTVDLLESIPFPRHTSLDDPEGRPLHALSAVASDGYAQAVAKVHPFFPTRLSLFYRDVNRLQNWQWNFNWDGQHHMLEIYPPGFIENLTFLSNVNEPSLSNRSLGGAADLVELEDDEINLEISVLLPADLSYIHIRLQEPFVEGRKIHCTFPADRKRYTIPQKLIKSLPAGNYDLTVVFETVQFQYRSGTPYPPWIISSQDWIYSRLKKRF